jgi:hypothetical protein
MAKVNKMHERLLHRLTSSTGKVIIPTRSKKKSNIGIDFKAEKPKYSVRGIESRHL